MTIQLEIANRVANLNITHPKITKIWSFLDSIRTQNKYKLGSSKSGKRHISVIGPSGVGKSQMGLRYAENNPGHTELSEDGLEEVDIRPVVYLELPDPFTIKELYQNISIALGFPEIPKRITIGEAQRQTFTLLKKQKVEVLILDELDYILTSNVPYKAAMNAIKKIANKANITLVLMGTPEVESTLIKINFQNFRRYPKYYMRRFDKCDEEWCNLLKAIDEQIALPEKLGLGEVETGLPELLFGMSKGLLGILIPVIQEFFSLLGLFEKDFRDVSKLQFNEESIDKLLEAYENINGDLTEEEMETMLQKGY
ncbi:TniB family NTP-binding protein [Paenibacillus sp. TAB 01]|uniref:TniB family NTP-binding protein n=1 Tax=Paenibacillus sp. TAB 01 TaxID=3368988 RepID=UPI00374FFB9C